MALTKLKYAKSNFSIELLINVEIIYAMYYFNFLAVQVV